MIAVRVIVRAGIPEGSDTLESFLSKVAFESDFRKKTF